MQAERQAGPNQKKQPARNAERAGGLRVLHVSDTHLGIRHYFRGQPRDWSRADDHLAAFRAALAYASDPDVGPVDLIIHSGDLFDRSHPPERAIRDAVTAFTEVAGDVPVILMPGNHDRLGLLHHAAGALAAVPGLTVTDQALKLDLRGIRIGLVPFHREPDAWAQAAAALGHCDVIVAHQAFDGARIGRYRFTAKPGDETIGPMHLPPRTSTILCGHIHPRQTHTVGPATVYYPGSTERTAFVERHQVKGCGLLELGSGVRYRTLDLPSRPMLEVDDEQGVDGVVDGSLVRLVGRARTREVEVEVIARGGWVVPWSLDPPTKQVGLFQ